MVDALKEVNLGTVEEPRPIYLSALLAIDEEITYIELFKEFKDVFSWSYEEMPSLDPKVGVHHLAVKSGARPVKQAQRRFRLDLVPLIESKVNKLIEAGFIREVKYPTWVTSSVPLMIDTTTGYEEISFMDGLSGYNQIRMAPKDEELTAFRAPKGIYCYKVMPFGLKNAGATYQRDIQNILMTFSTKMLNVMLTTWCKIEKEERPLERLENDFLADHLIPDNWELTDELPDEDAMVVEVQPSWKMYFDDVAYRRGAGAGIVFVIPQGEGKMKHSKLCKKHILGLKACEFHTNFIHQPPEVLRPTVVSWPFDAWGLDVVGPLPKSSSEHLYILAATYYFSKWVEVVALKKVKKENIVIFIRVNIIYRFGIPHYIITDNGKPFDNRLMNKIYDLFSFKQRNSYMYNDAANNLVEAFNKTLCNLLKKVVPKSKRDWHDRMEEDLWAYRITHRTPTQATPYSLVYGVEAVLPLECQIPSLGLAIQEGITDEENARLRFAELEVLDEKRLEAQQSLECY
ncbi:uncharacterized protein [Nicotiana tomentosiformis]|uniref:uncharacterized protein n=1 Tax=Nicotiana tomentosiformis TaxID=4098 RepID=UPI00388CB847